MMSFPKAVPRGLIRPDAVLYTNESLARAIEC